LKVPEDGTIAIDDLVYGHVEWPLRSIEDQVLLKSDGFPTYQLAVVIDDHVMQISHVFRGEDWLPSTPKHLLVYRAFGWDVPPHAHLPNVLGPDGKKLAKRHGATKVEEFRKEGYLPEAMTNYLALIGWSPRSAGGETDDDAELMPMDELARRFALEDVGHSAGVFDPEKLAWMNRHYMKVASPARMAAESARYFQARGFLKRKTETAMAYVESVLPMAIGSVDRLEEVPDRLSFLFGYDAREALLRPPVAEVVHEPGAREVIAALAEEIEGPLLDREAFRAMATRVKEKTGQKGKALFHPIRVALTGESGGPELDLAVPAIDRGAQYSQDAGLAKILSCRERAKAFAAAVQLAGP
jgi:glutamyl-tRNA synthetase